MSTNFSTDETGETPISYPFQNIDYKLQILLLTATALLENGASTAQTKRHLYRTALFLELPEGCMHSHIDYSTVMINILDDKHVAHAAFSHSVARGVHLTKISAVSRLIWRATKRDYSLEKYEAELKRIMELPTGYSPKMQGLGAGLTCGGICHLFGGDLGAAVFIVFCALAAFLVRRRCNEHHFNGYAGIVMSTFVGTALACLLPYLHLSATPIHAILAASIFLIPGIPLINSMEDILEGYILSGITRLANTLFIIASIAFGIILALYLAGSEDITAVSIRPEGLYFTHALAAAVNAIGLSLIFDLPKKLLAVVALGAIISVELRNIMLIHFSLNIIAATFIGAATVGILGQLINHRLKAPEGLLTLPSVIPLIPGVLLYRVLYALLNISTIELTSLFAIIRNGIEAVTIITVIAIGITIPMIFFRPYIEAEQRKRLEKVIVERYT
ncbi:MAG: threonine/serine exporter family protein [Selenomonadaceae bacterium]|nr:threonine/serine exporter family protein [Selenomonadaceae bacterium]